jgi:uncharacterized protein YjiS (DUF1127 family)
LASTNSKRAQWQAGKLIEKIEGAQGARTDTSTSLPVVTKLKQYKDIGINKFQAHQWQAGKLLSKMDKNTGQLYRGYRLKPRGEEPTYSDIGINKKQAHQWQTIASMQGV